MQNRSIKILILLLLVPFLNLKGQSNPKWLNYFKDTFINDIAFEGNTVWISTLGGLAKIDQTTSSSTLYNSCNSGITNGNIRHTLVASNGDKWISTYTGGLLRFDGTNWTTFYSIPTGDTIWNVLKTAEDNFGNIWISSYPRTQLGQPAAANTLLKFDGTTFTKIQLPVLPAANNITSIECDQNGNMWMVSGDNIFKYDGISFQIYNSSNSLFTGNPKNLIIDNSNNIWFTSYAGSSLYLVKYNGVTFYNYLVPFSGGAKLSVDPNNNILLFGAQGILNFDGSAFTQINGLPYQQVGCAYRDSNGKLFVGFNESAKEIFYIYDPANSSWTSFFLSTSQLLSNYALLRLAPNNTRWIKDGHGIVKFDGTTWHRMNTANSGIPDDDIYTFLIASNNDLWVGYYNNNSSYPLAKFDGTNWEYFDLAQIFPTGFAHVKDIAEDLNGDIWVTTGEGIGRYSGGTWTFYTDATLPVTTNFFLKIGADASNNIWSTINAEGILKFDGTNWIKYTSTNSGLNDDNVLDFTFDQNNNLWLLVGLATVQKFDGTTWTTYDNTTTGITYANAFVIEFNENDSTIWIGSPNELIKYDGSTWQRMDVFNSPISSGIGEVAIDGYNNKWISTGSSGIIVHNENGIQYSNIFNLPRNILKGNIFYDQNSNGIDDSPFDHGLSGRKIILYPDSTQSYTNSIGQYFLRVNNGNHEIKLHVDSNWTITSDSSSYQVQIAGNNIDSLDFGLNFTGSENHATISCVPLTDRCFNLAKHVITYRNEGTNILNGEIRYISPVPFIFTNSVPTPTSISGDTLIWNYSNLLQFEERQILATFQNPGPQLPGTHFLWPASISNSQTILGTDTADQEITCSYDPNDKKVFPLGAGIDNEVLINEILNYTIRFQNTGNDTAFFVMLIDSLSLDFDLSSFEFLSSSHTVQVSLNKNLLKFTFEDINLLCSSINEPESHGFVKFRIRPKSSLSLPRVISNSAQIYFDFNPYIETNVVFNTIVANLTNITSIPIETNSPELYPNPASDKINISLPDKNKNWVLELYDGKGNLVLRRKLYETNSIISTEKLVQGIYLIRIMSNNNQYFSKKVIIY
jgi:uncharacterized repeat protein (TIGR01451 family)